MTTTASLANALYIDADGSRSLVVLDDSDTLLETVQADLTDAQVEDIFAGDTAYRAAARMVEVGDGDTFYRLTPR